MPSSLIKDIEYLEFIYVRLRLFKRYRDTPHRYEESIAEHQYYVAFLAKIICDKLMVSDDIKLKCLEIALIHDENEAISDDFVFSLKYKNGANDFKRAVEAVEEGIMKELTEKIEYDDMESRYNEYKERKTLSAKIVKCADWLSVILFCDVELGMGNNKHIKVIRENAKKRLNPLVKEIMSYQETKIK